jgi:hypothetical protein
MIGLHLVAWLSFFAIGALLVAAMADARADLAQAQLEDLEWAIRHDLPGIEFDLHAESALALAHG